LEENTGEAMFSKQGFNRFGQHIVAVRKSSKSGNLEYDLDASCLDTGKIGAHLMFCIEQYSKHNRKEENTGFKYGRFL
jgi:hypothetical protein